MKRMKKFLVAFLVLSFMLPTLASCNNAEQAETTTEAEAEQEGGQSAANEAVEGAYPLELWTFQELHVDFYVDMADKWNEKYPDKPIELTVSQQTSSAMHTKMLVALTSGEGGPDISDIEVGHFANFIKPDDVLLLPLNDVIEPEKDNVVMSRQEMYSDEQGNIYGIDFHVGMTVSYYNMDIMNEAGVDPNSIETWEDYANVGKTVLEATGKPMTIVETGDLFLPQCMLLEKNVQYVTDAGEPNIATSDHADVLAFIRSMN
uniref:ABC transporter substrate-binding protein n=1 Tax=Alkalibaculum bacchi TaxID=645887 RepID=UPI0026EF49A0